MSPKTGQSSKSRSRIPDLTDRGLTLLIDDINEDLDRSVKLSLNMKRLVALAPFMSARQKLKCLDFINFTDDDGIEVESPQLLRLLYSFMEDEKVSELAASRR